MSDGCEERRDQEMRRQEEARKNREDWIDHDLVDPWKPEREDS